MPCGEFDQPRHQNHYPHHSIPPVVSVEAFESSPLHLQYIDHQHHQQQQPPAQQQQPLNQQQQRQRVRETVSNLNLNLNQMMAALPRRAVGEGGGGSQKAGLGVSPHRGSSPVPHHLTVDVNLNHVLSPQHRSPTSPNPLDNDNLRRQSTGLSAFNDYVVSDSNLFRYSAKLANLVIVVVVVVVVVSLISIVRS
ncbi:hypothetical protein PoB_001572300 [Plakobranchus ocellatus]|uniref:Uncharacterized protein n=1 Tax=Plakobranchus ocellatus TaxID=259542 RepID=A0AAV3Z3N2_9GAST|nr:hypothetical protein PoB_001572300 [Plakobranchus ocellatus]